MSQPTVDRKNTMLKGKLRLVPVSLLILVVAWLCWLFGELILYQAVWGPALEAELGFKVDTPYIDGQEVVQLTYVKPGGRLYTDGFRSGDVLVELDVRQFYKILKNLRGSVPLSVKVSSPVPGNTKQREERTIIL